jgi:hypothetical protein
LSSEEQEIWGQLQDPVDGPVDIDVVLMTLLGLQHENVPLSARSHQFLLLDTDDERTAFVQQYRGSPLKPAQAITALATLHQNTVAEG